MPADTSRDTGIMNEDSFTANVLAYRGKFCQAFFPGPRGKFLLSYFHLKSHVISVWLQDFASIFFRMQEDAETLGPGIAAPEGMTRPGFILVLHGRPGRSF